MTFVFFATSPIITQQADTLDLFLQAGFVAKLVLLCLLIASVFSWAVIVSKARSLKSAQNNSQAFLKMFWQGQDLEEVYLKCDQYRQAPVPQVFKSGFKELKKLSQLEGHKEILKSPGGLENISRALTRATMAEVSQMESRIGILASIASSAPFVGLFGTVWGIMNSFQGIGATGSANLAVVAPGISEALIATAAGLAAAIPAVVAYNYFSTRIKVIATEMDTFSQDFLNLVQRNILKG